MSREDVLAAARTAFSERGFEGTTLAQIAGRLGVSPAALLRHAPSKQGLFAAAMTESGEPDALPMSFLAEVDGGADPAVVLRRVARTFVPFLHAKLGQVIALYLRGKAEGRSGLPLPFDPYSKQSPPRRFLALLEGYFRRARRAGRLRVSDPRAAALAFMGALHSYVFLHEVVKIQQPALPLERYLDALLEVWTHGAIRAGRRRQRKAER